VREGILAKVAFLVCASDDCINEAELPSIIVDTIKASVSPNPKVVIWFLPLLPDILYHFTQICLDIYRLIEKIPEYNDIMMI
jgi:hypothetical protein